MIARLHPDDLAALADLVAERVAARLGTDRPERDLLTAQEVAGHFGVSAEWVRENAERLGVVRLGDGPRPRLRFVSERVMAAMTAREEGGGSDAQKPSRRRASPLGAG